MRYQLTMIAASFALSSAAMAAELAKSGAIEGQFYRTTSKT